MNNFLKKKEKEENLPPKIDFLESPSSFLKRKLQFFSFRKKQNQDSDEDFLLTEDEESSHLDGNLQSYFQLSLKFGFYLFFIALIFWGVSLFVNILSFKNLLIRDGRSAISYLEQGVFSLSNLSGAEASKNFLLAEKSFLKLQTDLDNFRLKRMVKFIPKYGTLATSGDQLVDLGIIFSRNGRDFASSLNLILEKDKPLTERVGILISSSEKFLIDFSSGKKILDSIDPNILPDKWKSLMIDLQNLSSLVEKDVIKIKKLSKVILPILGSEEKKRYLIIFQNNTEMRPTGGFIGSLALLDFYQGKLQKLEIPGGGPYDLKSNLLLNIIPPEPMLSINYRWEIQDANWFPDFPTSAENIAWFFEKSGGYTLDGVIALDILFFQDFLEKIGEIDLPDYKMKITADNFWEKIQNYVEFEYDKKENKPKKILGDLASAILIKLKSKNVKEYFDFLPVIYNSLIKKDLLFYFASSKIQREFSDLGFTGEIKTASRDYLQIVHTNLGGAKSDAVISEKVDLTSNINNEGEVVNELIITREHKGKLGDKLSGVRNIDYLRIYVPEESELLEASGFVPFPEEFLFEPVKNSVFSDLLFKVEKDIKISEKSGTRISKEFGKTVFGNWLQIDPGQKIIVKIKYKLPFKIEFEDNLPVLQDNLANSMRSWLFAEKEKYLSFYSLFFQKQPGAFPINFSQKVMLPKNFKIVSIYPDLWKVKNNYVFLNKQILTDEIFGIILRK